jgi:hypothetical protein
VKATGHRAPYSTAAGDVPVYNVSWDDAQSYCHWAGGRLPTEAEWEYAARGGKEGLDYPNSDKMDAKQARFNVPSGPGVVGKYPPNGYGLYDMAGNVSEWTADWFDGAYYGRGEDVDPQGPATGEYKVIRGGAWSDAPRRVTVFFRNWVRPNQRTPNIGFRCVVATPGAAKSEVYRNDFNDAPGKSYAEWTATRGQTPMVVEAANHTQRFLGEFGGEKLVGGPPFVRVDQTVSLTLKDLPAHHRLQIELDLYVLKSWDGDNAHYGPDRWKFSVAGGPVLLDTTFSNNHKTGDFDLSLQGYPAAGSPAQTGAAAVNTLGYRFFGDAVYHLKFAFEHSAPSAQFDFSSSLFEGKGTDDESWGLDNVRVSTVD